MRAVLFLPLLLGVVDGQESALAVWQREKVDGMTRLELNSHPSLRDYVDYAQLNNPDIDAALWSWKAALESVIPARSWADPTVAMGHFLRSVETRDGPQQQRLSIAQPIPWPSVLDARGRVASAAADAERWRYEERRAAVTLAVVNAYLDCYYLERAIDTTERNLQLVAHVEEVVRMRYRSGQQQHSDLMNVQVELGRIEDQLHSLRDGRKPAAASLNTLLGRHPDAAVVAVDSPQVTQFEMDSLRVWALRNNPHLQMLRAGLASAQHAIELSKKERYPDLMLGVDYVRTGARPAGDASSGKDPLVLMATVSLPVWRGKNQAEVNGATARYQALRSALEDGASRLLAQLENALFQRRESQRKVSLYGEDLLAKAEQALIVTQQSFIAGSSGFFELVNAQRTLLELQLVHEEARVERMRQEAQIRRLIGWRLLSRNAMDKESSDHDR